MPDFNDMDKNLKCSARLIMCMAEDNEFAREVRRRSAIMMNVILRRLWKISAQERAERSARRMIRLRSEIGQERFIRRIRSSILDFTDGADEPPFETFMEALREAGYLEEDPSNTGFF